MPPADGPHPAAAPSQPTHRTLIVARMDPADADAVAETFAESDAGELPGIVGVTRRELFAFHGLYFHLVDAPADIAPAVANVREHPLFVDVNRKLEKFIGAYDPATWRGPRDAMARSFYRWTAG
ncbi:conserved hypothetical protein [Frankia canadensis]|uniref:Polyketide synthesis cyclase n=1 Tax=Frankia canadensis TaxID=1836972 RepID=A0A2I2KJZ1_9ACTN|nr:TcmI family type II polyketide cyclase [Frankia canadensis]SNQ45980.1 conserved hypothetical protein [Frankia canadensis]SOU53270.1 conserved hypothetical protein [Frankia canadensis]